MKVKDFIYWTAIALFLIPFVGAVPEVRPTGDATVFIDGTTDRITFAGGSPSLAETPGFVVVAPDGESITFQKTGPGNGNPAGVTFTLDGTLVNGQGWVASGDLSGAVADGTFTIRHTPGGQYSSNNATLEADQYKPAVQLYVQGKGIVFAVSYLGPQTHLQAWNWHQTTGVWREPSTDPGAPTGGLDPVDEGPEEDPQFARYFAESAPPVPSVPDDDPRVFTANSTVQCPTGVDITGVGARGTTQTNNTFGRFWYIDGFQPASTDLSLLPAAQSTTITDLGSSFNFTHNATVFYNGVAGTSYQFEARNGTTGDWQKGLTMFAGPLQCTQPDIPDLSDLEHDEGALQIQTSGGACKDQRIVLNVMLDKPLLGGEMFEVFIANATSGLVLGTFGNNDFNVDPGDVNYFNSFAFPSGEYAAVVLADLQGTPAYDHFDSYPVSVSPEPCVIQFTDATVVLDSEILNSILANVTNTNDGALLLNNMDFEGLSFDGFLILLLLLAILAAAFWNGYTFIGLVAGLGAAMQFMDTPPIGFVGIVFLIITLWFVEYFVGGFLAKRGKGKEGPW